VVSEIVAPMNEKGPGVTGSLRDTKFSDDQAGDHGRFW